MPAIDPSTPHIHVSNISLSYVGRRTLGGYGLSVCVGLLGTGAPKAEGRQLCLLARSQCFGLSAVCWPGAIVSVCRGWNPFYHLTLLGYESMQTVGVVVPWLAKGTRGSTQISPATHHINTQRV